VQYRADVTNLNDVVDAGDGSTTGQRTHRYLRLALVAVIVVLFLAVALQIAVSGQPPLPSISHYYYTPAGALFAAALIAATLALVALSGRDTETVLLDIAAVFAPLVAIVPTGYVAAVGLDGVSCPTGTSCVPEPYLDATRLGVAVYAIMVGLVVVTALILAAVQKLPWRGVVVVSVIGLAVTAALLALTFAPGLDAGFPFNDVLGGESIHYIVTIAFFAAFALVPLVNAIPREREPGEAPLTTGYQIVYLAIPLLMFGTLALMYVLRDEVPGIVFWCEFVALFLFALFWAVQTVHRWNESNPRSLL
jgi:hypothetical protein